MSLGALFPSARPANFSRLVEDARRMAGTHYSGDARALAGWKVEAARLTGVPVLVLGGALDTPVTPDRVREQAGLPGAAVHVLEGRGHGFPQEDPPGFLALLP